MPEIVFSDDTKSPQLLIYKYIEGDTINDTGLFNDEPAKIASIMAEFHLCANGASNFEDFIKGVKSQTTCAEDFIISLKDEADACRLGKDRTNELCNKAQSLMSSVDDKDYVLLHNDFHFKNIIRRSRDKELIVIDWDSAIIGPREKDFVKLLDWSKGNDEAVPSIMKEYETATQYELNSELIEMYRVYAALRQIHFQTKMTKDGVDKDILEQGGFFAGNEENNERIDQALSKLGL